MKQKALQHCSIIHQFHALKKPVDRVQSLARVSSANRQHLARRAVGESRSDYHGYG